MNTQIKTMILALVVLVLLFFVMIWIMSRRIEEPVLTPTPSAQASPGDPASLNQLQNNALEIQSQQNSIRAGINTLKAFKESSE